jgi:Protein of unknown function (DUF4233)
VNHPGNSESASGLRNPPAAVRGAGAGALAAMALVLLMAIVPLVRLDAPGAAIAVVAVLAGVASVLCGLLRRGWAWNAALLVPVTLLAAGFLHTVLAVLGVLFGLLWAYMLYVRRTVLSGR